MRAIALASVFVLVVAACAGSDPDPVTIEPSPIEVAPDEPEDSPDAAQPDEAPPSSAAACPAFDGSSPRQIDFDSEPPLCINLDETYTATFVTNFGDVVVELDTTDTPNTANNFVVLALYGYYDGTELFRTAPSIAIIQGGAPRTNDGADPGPGYTIQDEADGFSYVAGDLAMARTGAPNSAGAQFFFGAGPEIANLDGPPGNPDGLGLGTYVTFGRTVGGQEVLEEILSLHVADSSPGGGGPSETVLIETVTIDVG